MLETESLAKAKAGGSMDCFVYDPANAPAPKKVIPAPSEPAGAPRSLVGVEVFCGKLFAGITLEDAKGVEKLLTSGVEQQQQSPAKVVSPIDYLLRLKRDIQQLKEDAGRAAVTSVPPLQKLNQMEQTLDPILTDERVAPYLPHVSPSLHEMDPVEALIIRMRAAEGATFHAVGKQQRIQPVVMEQQVQALEKFVGPPSGAPLRKRLMALQRDISVLDGAFLVSCSRRIKSMLTEVVLLDQQKRAAEVVLPTEVQARVDALNGLNAKHYTAVQEVLKPNSPLVVPIPQQEASARVLQRLHTLAHQQRLVSDMLNADGASLKMLSENLVANMKLMKSNISGLEHRLQQLPRC